MLINLYTIKDLKTKAFGKIFMFQNDEIAARQFHVALITDDTMSQFPDDYVLYAIGVYDDDSGVITANSPERMLTGPEALNKLTKEN